MRLSRPRDFFPPGCKNATELPRRTKTLSRNSSILVRKHRYLRDAISKTKRKSETLSSSKSREVSFSQPSHYTYSTGTIVCSREFTQSRMQSLGFAFINGNVYRTIYRNRLGSRRVDFQEREGETAGVDDKVSNNSAIYLFFLITWRRNFLFFIYSRRLR